jgi:O-antigen/teichoic acid export membrane protein
MSLRIFLRDHPGRLFAGTSFGPVKAMFKYASVFAFIQILGVFLNKTNVFFLERYVGVKGVAHYSAGFMAVDGISVLASEQLLSWVIFPLLSVLWWKKREEVAPLIRNTALWLMAISLPLMFVIYAESAMIIDLIYPEGFQDAIWVQQTLTPCIFIAFENNLFCFVMMVVGSAKLLLAFSIIGALVNMILNITLTPGYGLLGACLVIVLSKLTMMIQTGFYCQWKLKLFRGADFLFPLILGGSLLMIHILLKPIISIHAATIIPLVIYGLVLWRLGPRIMGELRKREDLALD